MSDPTESGDAPVSGDPGRAVQQILTTQLLPALRAAVADLGGDFDESLVHTAPSAHDSGWPTNTAAALVHHLCGVVTSWGAACLGGEAVDRDRTSEFAYAGPVGPELDRLDAHLYFTKEKGVFCIYFNSYSNLSSSPSRSFVCFFTPKLEFIIYG